MRALFGTVASGQIPPVTAFAFDASSVSTSMSANTASSPVTFTHTPVGVPKGALVLVAIENASATPITSVTYGGVTMTEVALSPFAALLGSEENTVLAGFFLGSSVPTGAQTVSIALTGVGGFGATNAAAFSVVGPNNSAIEDTSTVDTAGADPTVALTVDEESFVCGVLMSGHDTTAPVTVGAGMTQVNEIDVGGQAYCVARRTALISTNTTLDWTATTEDYAILGVAIKST